MTTIDYADLTWPEVAALPRHVPLLIPLGLGTYDLALAARRLKCDTVVTLPAIPYGFPQSNDLGGLAVGTGLLRRVLLGVARELHAQGFRRVAFLDGHRVARRVARKGLRFLETAPRPGGPDGRLPRDLAGRVVVISTGHTEQHGLHLPLDTDTAIVAAIASGLHAAEPERVVCLPAWPYGVSTHTRQYPGTLNLGGRTFEDFFLTIVGKLVARGARAVLFSNGHGGNHSFLVNVVKWAGERWPEAFTATEWLHTTGPELERLRQSEMGGMGHGCELETSYMLHLRPGSVRVDRARRETDFIRTPEYFMDWTEGGRLIANPPWTDDTQTGIYGDPTLATAEKGRLWLEAAIREKVESVKEVLEQLSRREQRRRQREQAAGAPSPARSFPRSALRRASHPGGGIPKGKRDSRCRSLASNGHVRSTREPLLSHGSVDAPSTTWDSRACAAVEKAEFRIGPLDETRTCGEANARNRHRARGVLMCPLATEGLPRCRPGTRRRPTRRERSSRRSRSRWRG